MITSTSTNESATTSGATSTTRRVPKQPLSTTTSSLSTSSPVKRKRSSTNEEMEMALNSYKSEWSIVRKLDTNQEIMTLNELLESKPDSSEETRERFCVTCRERYCIICKDRPYDITFLPCGHCCLCSECTVQLRDETCPICRCEIEAKYKKYYC
jgi:Zinc finger, C3HC4 type (RING finger)